MFSSPKTKKADKRRKDGDGRLAAEEERRGTREPRGRRRSEVKASEAWSGVEVGRWSRVEFGIEVLQSKLLFGSLVPPVVLLFKGSGSHDSVLRRVQTVL